MEAEDGGRAADGRQHASRTATSTAAATVPPSEVAVVGVAGVSTTSVLGEGATNGVEPTDMSDRSPVVTPTRSSTPIPNAIRNELVTQMMVELRRITGLDDTRHLRRCASRYEASVWKKCTSRLQYMQRLESRIQSLRRHSPGDAKAIANVPTETYQPLPGPQTRSRTRRAMKQQHQVRSSNVSTELQYFVRLRDMQTKYRDEVALVFRELCRVNTVIQHSACLRRHDSNNLGDFLANLKKIIYLLEQRPGEVGGIIPPRKRTLEYLEVLETHIQRKVLPILERLRHTYSSILRPIVLNYLRHSPRFSR